MGAYNWIVILFCLGFIGLLYASVYDVVLTCKENAYTETPEAATTVNIMWKCWQFFPLGVIVACFIYAYLSGQKKSGGF